MAPPPRELMVEIVEEILLHFPPDDPASLARAALVCKLWCRLVCDAAFRHRFREFHHIHSGAVAPLLLGLLYNDSCHVRRDDNASSDPNPQVNFVHLRQVPIAYFVPTTSFRPAQAAAGRYGWRAIDARHGGVLLLRHRFRDARGDLCVWDPVTGEQRHLPEPPFYTRIAAVACATAAGDDGGDCNHLDCRQGPFLVVAMGIWYYSRMHVSIYSSEAGAWSNIVTVARRTSISGLMNNDIPGVLVRSTLCILVHYYSHDDGIVNHEIVMYDLATRRGCTVQLPSKFQRWKRSIVVITDDDGGLGFVANMKNKLELWSRVAGADGDAGFVLTRLIDLWKVLPSGALMMKKKQPQVNGFADCGAANRVLFIRTFDGLLYSIEINSSQVSKVANCCGDGDVIPYMSFCTPTSRVQH